MPAPRKFSQEQLQHAALALVDEHGLAALTMRSLATALGTGAMTIYNYVDGRNGLEALVVGAVMAEARCPDPAPEDWRAAVRAIAEANWLAIRAHPNVIPLILTRRTLDEPNLDLAEALLQALIRGGRSGARLLAAFRTVSGFVAGFAQAELTGPLSLARGESVQSIIDHVRALPAESFPGLIEIATAAATSDAAAEFHAGLDIIIAGLDT